MHPEDLKERIEDIYKFATSGPWRYEGRSDMAQVIKKVTSGYLIADDVDANDAQFIVGMMNLMPDIIDTLEECCEEKECEDCENFKKDFDRLSQEYDDLDSSIQYKYKEEIDDLKETIEGLENKLKEKE